MNGNLKKAIALFISFITVLLLISLYLNDWHFIYVIDDPYIHMTIAKNFSTLGLWAVNGMSFVSATSSPLWSLLISGLYFITGVNPYIPFILNILFSIAAIWLVSVMLKKFKLEKYSFTVILVFIIISPLPALVFTGMEHIAQIFFALLFVYLSSAHISENKKIGEILPLIIISAILTALRYEDMFLVFSVSVIFILRKKYFAAILVFAAGLLPIIVYGIISESHNWMFLPNPVLVKSNLPAFSIIEALKIPFRAVKKMLEPDILFILPVSIYVYIKCRSIKISGLNQKQLMFYIFIIAYVLHMLFAQTGWYFRYEAYLVSLGIIVLWLNIYDHLPAIFNPTASDEKVKRPIFKRIFIVLIIVSLCGRTVASLFVPQSTNNIYNQQYQMAMLLNRLPQNTVIAANDIGMINFYSDKTVVDLWGLADLDAAKYKIAHTYNTAKIDSITNAKNVKIAVLYEPWFAQYGGLPHKWQKIGEWKMTRLNIVCGNETVSFYSLDSSQTESYRRTLEGFSKELPASVIYSAN
ncbi:MAG: hypothetical protein ABI543_05200 [Ignavibacteria bacterium]